MSEDVINHPKHYETDKVECIEAMEITQGRGAVMSFCLCNAFKYLWRHQRKNGVEDVKKAQWYLNKYIELAEKEGVPICNELKKESLDFMDAPKELKDELFKDMVKDAAQRFNSQLKEDELRDLFRDTGYEQGYHVSNT